MTELELVFAYNAFEHDNDLITDNKKTKKTYQTIHFGGAGVIVWKFVLKITNLNCNNTNFVWIWMNSKKYDLQLINRCYSGKKRCK